MLREYCQKGFEGRSLGNDIVCKRFLIRGRGADVDVLPRDVPEKPVVALYLIRRERNKVRDHVKRHTGCQFAHLRLVIDIRNERDRALRQFGCAVAAV